MQSRAAWLRGRYEDITTSLWFRPMFWLVGMGMLAIALLAIDQTDAGRAVRDSLPQMLLGDTDSVRTMLGAIVGAMLTVMSISFTLMMSTVTQAANSYTPRLLRQYIGDRQNQNVLGILIGTFLYSVLVLYSIRGGETVFVPVIASNVALILSIVSIIAFVYFLNHTASSIKVGNIITLIVSSTQEVIHTPFRASLGQDWEKEENYSLPTEEPHVILAEETGYLQVYELQEVFERAIERDVVVNIINKVGDFVMKGSPIMEVWPAESADDELHELIRTAFVVNRERTDSQDIYFGIRQLSDIALRALSPGINDPTTAINIIHSLAALLATILDSDVHSHVRCDENGNARLLLPEETFQKLVNEAFVQVRHYGIEDFLVVFTLVEMTGRVGYSANSDEDKEILWKFIITTMQMADEKIKTPTEREKVNEGLEIAAKIMKKDYRHYALDLQSEIQLPSSLL